MAIDKLNLFMQKMPGITGSQQPVSSVQPASQEASGTNPIFAGAVKGFSQKVNPFASEQVSFGSTQNYRNGLSQLGEGALGENALYTKNGRLGKDLNFIA